MESQTSTRMSEGKRSLKYFSRNLICSRYARHVSKTHFAICFRQHFSVDCIVYHVIKKIVDFYNDFAIWFRMSMDKWYGEYTCTYYVFEKKNKRYLLIVRFDTISRWYVIEMFRDSVASCNASRKYRCDMHW